jgi:N utilization substance protein B
VPESVAINDAVELAKKYSGDGDYSFINGILGSYSRDKKVMFIGFGYE